MDPILTENLSRFSVFPILYPDIWDMYNKQRQAYWTEGEINFKEDLEDWKKLTKDEQHFIKMVLSFFANADGIVMENLCERFSSDVQIPEARLFYSFQNMMEGIHSITYAMFIETLISDDEEKRKLFKVTNIPSIQRKSEWALKWIKSTDSFADRLIAFACVEGIFFSSSFASIFWVKERGLMPGLTFSNELISRDERLHCDFAILLHSKLLFPSENILQIVQEAVEIEINFVQESLPTSLIGINEKVMSDYVKFVADFLLIQLNQKKIYHIKNPLPFMDRICFSSKTNFFEKKVSNYQSSTEYSNELIFDF
jgi:ribonucleotide reductase beta subunit family protein with ferritin-like domain